MGLLSDIKDKYNDIRFTRLINGTKSAGKLLDSGLDKLGIVSGAELTQSMLMEIQKSLFTSYITKRDKEYEGFLTSVNYNSGDYNAVKAEVKKFSDWRSKLRDISIEHFGDIWNANQSISRLYAENEKMLDMEVDKQKQEELKANIEALDNMREVSGPLSKVLEGIWKTVEQDLSKSEDDYARRLMHSL